MLKHRILTALVLIPSVIWGIYRLSSEAFMFLTLLLTLIAAWEWGRLSGQKRLTTRIIYCGIVAFLAYSNLWHLPELFSLITPIWWLFALGLLIFLNKRNTYQFHFPFLLSSLGIIILLTTWYQINVLRYYEPYPAILLFFLLLIWGADIGAYFVGRYIGQHKLAPTISPNKTWEGVWGAIIVTLILALMFAIFLHLSIEKSFLLVILSEVTIIFSIVGDLFESVLKRNQQVKDSGTIFPGHGGMLDRIDSLVAALPIFTLGYLLLIK
ncbi:MAG: Phosphatidate cytidylyltransferase [Legionellaceae bacterium]